MFIVWFFFFFKQKTAYEMRISDWSSDVCSSDLRQQRMQRPPGQLAMADLAPAGRTHAARLAHRVGREVVVQHEMLAVFARQRVEIGRASCRERVCQYV